MTEKRKPLAAAEASLRRLLLMVGFGVLSYIAGTIFMSDLVARIALRFETQIPGGVGVLLLYCGWAVIVLPALAYGCSRFMELKPWSTGIVGVGSGAAFQFALTWVTKGDQAISTYGGWVWGWAAGLAVGVAVTAQAVKQARAAAAEAETKAQAAAEAKKSQYDEFVKQSEALAERRDQVPIAAAPDPEDRSR